MSFHQNDSAKTPSAKPPAAKTPAADTFPADVTPSDVQRIPAAPAAGLGTPRIAEAAADAAADDPDLTLGAAEPADQSVAGDLFSLLRAMLTRAKGWPIARLSIAIVVVLIANMYGQIRLNQWNGTFFDAVERRDMPVFLDQLWVFLAIVAGLLVAVVSQTWLQERLKIRLRERVTQVLFDLWLKPNRAYQLGLTGAAGGQPDQRLQEDCRLFAEFSTELGVGMLQATMLLVCFIGVLWGLSATNAFEFHGITYAVPGFMVWVAIGYAGIGSGLTWLVGRPLIRLNTDRYAREADLRFAVVRVNESAESVALYSGEKDERRSLDLALDSVLAATRRLSGALARLTWITSGYGWLAIIVPILAAAPQYFSGRLSFGEMMMVVGAFGQVQAALRYFVDNFPKIADWRSALLRVSTFRQTARDLDRVIAENSQIEISRHPEGLLAFQDLSISLRNGSILIEDASAIVRHGERVLIVGESGSGKSTLFRAISGLWPWGDGRILTPPPEDMMFLPQRPYLPLGTLRAAICYPASPDSFDDERIRAALTRCGLEQFIDALDESRRWDQSLSLGQQQRVAFARVVLHGPRWVFMDESTSALDDDNQASMLSLFSEEMEGVSVLSIGHRPGLAEFHTRTLHIHKRPEGGVLLPTPAPRKRYMKRLWKRVKKGGRRRDREAA